MSRIGSKLVCPIIHVFLFTLFVSCTANLLAVEKSNAVDKDNAVKAVPLAGTKLLTEKGDIASKLVAGVDRFLLKQIQQSVVAREKHWKRDFSSPAAYQKSIQANRKRLAYILGLRDSRPKKNQFEFIATTKQSALVGRGDHYEIFAVRWRAFGNVDGCGLLLVPKGRKPIANVVAVPDCNQTPEMIAGLVKGVPVESQYARRLAESGCRVIVPMLINRQWSRRTAITNREWLYRAAFMLGRGLVGYEVQKVLAAVDCFEQEAEQLPVGVIGWGEGGLIAQYASAMDTRIGSTVVSGYFSPREKMWQEPLDRNLFGLLEQFGDAELAAMILPRTLIVEASKAPEAVIPGLSAVKVPWHGRTTAYGGPSIVVTPKLTEVKREIQRAEKLVSQMKPSPKVKLIVSGEGNGPFSTATTLQALLTSLSAKSKLAIAGKSPVHLRKNHDPVARHTQQLNQIDRHTQAILRDCHLTRKKLIFDKLNTSSIQAYEKSVAPLRKHFSNEVIGKFNLKMLPANVRTKKIEENRRWTRYQVEMDVFNDVIAYGLLTIPRDIKKGEKRPVVVCQHGLEGRPESTILLSDKIYAGFSTALANRGFITFAPQNLYIFQDRFRTLQRKGNPIKKTLFSVIVPQHQQITDWLKTLPQVDPKRIGFYGLSYGGKSAMRIPPLVSNYCLSICSADFNEWVDKNASTHNRRSYVNMGEYEIFEFDLGTTFNYAEMAALIAPRPFMVERGHYDGVADDWTVAWEYSKIRNLYAARLKIPDKTEIHWFDGPHAINGKRTYQFLHKHLNWPKPKSVKALGE